MHPISTSSCPPSASSKQLLPWLVAVAFFMESLDTTILNIAVPVVSQALNAAPLSMNSRNEWIDQPSLNEPPLENDGLAEHWDHRVDDDHYSSPVTCSA
jgi:hypothetical protein